MDLTHVNSRGEAHMVDVSEKGVTIREAKAEGYIKVSDQTLKRMIAGDLPKGDVMAAARIAGIQAAKKTSEIIPLCHTIPLDKVEILIEPVEESSSVRVESTVRCTWKTGVEMEALTSVSAALLTLYDMLKAIDKSMEITNIHLMTKTGGKSDYIRLS